MKPHLHACCSPPLRPDTRPAHRAWLYQECLQGHQPAEALCIAGMRDDRDLLLLELFAHGWTDVEVAQHTKYTTYTVGRLRGRLGAAANHDTSTRMGAA